MIAVETLFARAIFLFMSLRVIHASFGVCFKTLGPVGGWRREIVGFKLWNDRGQTADQYRTIYYAKKTKLSNNGWTLDARFIPILGYIDLKNLYIESVNYGSLGEIGMENICPNRYPEGRIFYGCYSSWDNPTYCNDHYDEYTKFCKFNYTMGTDNVFCGHDQ